ncbi:ABC transporter ATP-binding protein [Vibrio nitrifigilis]|uniref:ABC transporter ATP-binding protein n=1 Tax=Vibrio nitrifigilis TaxID=2789781 RepID=A0ABS0GFH2_9VIBR|nr:ABC transporter ATP-binding protein [Vibrio nitrifigilis]MBF9001156.1 ABC transporter ATP-binding protein [Vibrio nitrifigilis]
MKSWIKFKDVSFEYIKFTNASSGIKENFISFIKELGRKKITEEPYKVLNNINFELNEGDRLCIIGKNGAGKSTLLRLLTGIYFPSKGEIDINGKISSLIEIGAGMDHELTGRENIYIMGMISGFSKKEIRLKENEIIEFADIGDFIDVPVKYYSTGMIGRLSFSTATTINPEILIVDELFAGGDINFINKATDRIEKIKNEAKIFISVSHDMEYTKKFFNKIAYVKDNKIAYFGDDINLAVNSYINDN